MNRYGMFLAFALASAGAVNLLSAGPAPADKEEDCCAECTSCERTCLACASDCLQELAAGKTDRKECIRLCTDCADICGACSRISSRGGPMEAVIAATCAEACEKCAQECAKHKDDKSCQLCAERCLACAKGCKAKAKK